MQGVNFQMPPGGQFSAAVDKRKPTPGQRLALLYHVRVEKIRKLDLHEHGAYRQGDTQDGDQLSEVMIHYL